MAITSRSNGTLPMRSMAMTDLQVRIMVPSLRSRATCSPLNAISAIMRARAATSGRAFIGYLRKLDHDAIVRRLVERIAGRASGKIDDVDNEGRRCPQGLQKTSGAECHRIRIALASALPCKLEGVVEYLHRNSFIPVLHDVLPSVAVGG